MVEDTVDVIRRSWPVRVYLGSLAFAWLSMALLTPSLGGAEVNAARAAAQLAVCSVFVLRLGWAVKINEQSQTWRAYVVVMWMATPIWLAGEWLLRLC